MPTPLRHAAGVTLAALPPQLVNLAEGLGVAHPSDSIDKLAGLLAAGNTAEAHDFLLGFWAAGEAPVSSDPLELAQPLPPGLTFAEELMARDAVTYLPNDILVKVDRASMAVSLEARAPLLDRRLFEYAWGLPQSVKVKGKTGKWLLRQVLNQHVPEELTNRPKKGFAPPVKDWLLSDLKDWAEELLAPQALTENGLDAVPVTRAWEDLKAGRRNTAVKLWSVLMYQAWAKENL
jgi:asparagine synthase (glutamine-hydrolysing)